MQQLVGHIYSLRIINTSPADCGFGFIARPRQFAILLKKDSVKDLGDINRIFHEVTAALRQKIQPPEVSTCFVADAATCLEYENSKRAKRRLMPLLTCSESWEYLLTKNQQRYIRGYKDLWYKQHGKPAEACPNALFDMSQDPAKRPGTMKLMPTLRKSGTRLWIPSRGRWMMDDEMALAMGWPKIAAVAAAAGVPCDNLTYNAGQLGNSMHVFTINLVLSVVSLAQQANFFLEMLLRLFSCVKNPKP